MSKSENRKIYLPLPREGRRSLTKKDCVRFKGEEECGGVTTAMEEEENCLRKNQNINAAFILGFF